MINPSLLLGRPDESSLTAAYSRYHSDTALAQYCDAHYGPDKFGVPNFPARLARLCSDAAEGPGRRALDLGCAVGRAAFELGRRFDHVAAIDFSSRFIDIARLLQAHGHLSYQVFDEGDLVSDRRVRLADFGLEETASRVDFHQGNAHQLDEQFCDYDLVLAANLIDRLPDPGRFLAGIHRLLTVGGLLAIASPYNWLEPFTPRGKWLGGCYRAGAGRRSLDAVRRKLSRRFEAVGEPQDVELVLRENARKFQHYVSQLTLWRRVR